MLEKASTDNNTKISKPTKSVASDKRTLLEFFKKDPDKYEGKTHKEILKELLGKNDTRTADEIVRGLELNEKQNSQIRNNTSEIERLRVKYNYQPSKNQTNINYGSNANNSYSNTVNGKLEEMRFAENNGTARTQAGELSQADKEKVSQVMNETGLLST